MWWWIVVIVGLLALWWFFKWQSVKVDNERADEKLKLHQRRYSRRSF
jgi:hypothetical protein